MLFIKKNVPVDRQEKGRKKWPFSKMKIGDVVEVRDKNEWHEAVKYAHALASQKCWKMRAAWMSEAGRIRRIE